MEDFEKYANEYLKKYDDTIPMYEVITNKIFLNKFNGDTETLYKYCLDNKKTWQEVLEYEKVENVIY